MSRTRTSGMRLDRRSSGAGMGSTVRCTAARSIPGFKESSSGPGRTPLAWDLRAPLGWDADDTGPVGDACVALWSDLTRATTGEILHVDGGHHAVGLGPREAEILAATR